MSNTCGNLNPSESRSGPGGDVVNRCWRKEREERLMTFGGGGRGKGEYIVKKKKGWSCKTYPFETAVLGWGGRSRGRVFLECMEVKPEKTKLGKGGRI